MKVFVLKKRASRSCSSSSRLGGGGGRAGCGVSGRGAGKCVHEGWCLLGVLQLCRLYSDEDCIWHMYEGTDIVAEFCGLA